MDDLDDLLRRAMKSLDDQVPSGYFEDLPARTLARLEESMQTQSPGTEQSNPKLPVQTEREENSGLHDIRSLAHSTKARLSNKKDTSQHPVIDDVATSGAWKQHVALPEPAKMVALPSLDELPSAEQVLEAARQHEAATSATSATPGTATAKPAFSAWADKASQNRKKSKAPLFATLGMGLAAAAGAVLYLNHSGAKKVAGPDVQPAAEGRMDSEHGRGVNGAATQAPMAATVTTTPPAQAEIATGGKADEVDGRDQGQAAPEDKKEAVLSPAKTANLRKDADSTKKGGGGGTTEKTVPKDKLGTDKNTDTKVDTKGKGDKTKLDASSGSGAKKGGGEGEPNFDDLLKEAGVKDQPKDDKPKLDKKELTGDDFKNGMAAIKGKAAACYKGTQGTALVKLTVAPSGKIAKVAVGGQFAATPEGACVEAAVRSASFPPWDGAPQSFSYPILLSE